MAAASQAVLYFYDGFDYAAGTKLRNVPNWTSVSGVPASVNCADSLTYDSMSGIGGKAQLCGNATAYGSVRHMVWGGSSGVADPGTTNLFASLLLNVASVGSMKGGSYSACYIVSLRNLNNALLVITNNANNPLKFDIGIKQQNDKPVYGWDTNGGKGYDTGKTFFIVMSYTNGADNVWGSQLWINPALGKAAPAAANATIAQLFDGSSSNRVSIGCGNIDPETVMYIDELRVGSTWSDVTSNVTTP